MDRKVLKIPVNLKLICRSIETWKTDNIVAVHAFNDIQPVPLQYFFNMHMMDYKLFTTVAM